MKFPPGPHLIPFFVAGFPTFEDSEQLISAVVEAGVHIIELGVPASDPTADGPIIQKAHAHALRSGGSLRQTLQLSQKLKLKFPHLQIVLFTYFNPLLKMGLNEYTRSAKAAGVSATLTVDLPVEEALRGYVQAHVQAGLEMVFLATPTTGDDRLQKIQQLSNAFIYCVSRTGVTGVQGELAASLEQDLHSLRQKTLRPLALGFGISSPEQVKKFSKLVDFVVVGSFLVGLIDQNPKLCDSSRALVDFCHSALVALGREDIRCPQP